MSFNQEWVDGSTHVIAIVFMDVRMIKVLAKCRAFLVLRWIEDMVIHRKGPDVQ